MISLMISDGEVPPDVVPTAWFHSLTNSLTTSASPLPTVAAAAIPPPPEVATLKVSAAPVTQREQSTNRKDERIHCQSMRAADLP